MSVPSPDQTPSPMREREKERGLVVNNLGMGTTKLYVNRWEDTDFINGSTEDLGDKMTPR